jgi:flagellar hook-length control protein FliK
VIEVSTPIQAQSSLGGNSLEVTPPGVAPENSSSFSVFGKKTGKKDKLGVFAKLLEGLSNKTKGKTGGLSGMSGVSLGEAQGALEVTGIDSDEGAISHDKAGKKLSRAKKTAFLAEIGAADNQIIPLPGMTSQDMKDIQEFLDSWNRDLKTFRLSDLSAGESLQDAGQTEEFPALHLGVESGEEKAEMEAFSRENRAFPIRVKEETTKKNREDADIRANQTRNPENSIVEFSGETGLGREKAAEAQVSQGRARKGRERLNIEVRDFRTHQDSPLVSETAKTSAVFQTERFDAELVTDLKIGGSQSEGGRGEPGGTGGFEEVLGRELREHLSNDIVRQASLVLRNGGEGTLRLSLKPESLGNVKIRLEMSENKITGHIVVESSEAFKAFERELPVLEKQFQESGFGETSLDMAFAQDGGNSGAGGGFPDGEYPNGVYPQFSPVAAASSYDAEVEHTGRAGISGLPGGNPEKLLSVNMLV